MAANRLVYIDSLRGFAALGVIAVHSGQCVENMPPHLLFLTQQGQYGVQLFYVISAFTLFFSLSMRVRDDLNWKLNFFIRRFFRIAPLFWCAIIFYLFKDGLGPRYWMGSVERVTPKHIIGTFLFVNGWNPYWINSIVPGGWSIAIEMMFYLLVPFLYQKVKSLRGAVIFTLMALLLSKILFKAECQISVSLDYRLWSSFFYFWLPNQMPIFGLGFILYFARQAVLLWKYKFLQQREVALILAASCPVMWYIFSRKNIFFFPTHFLFSISFVVLALALEVYPLSLLVNRFTCYIGKISYSLYLVHFALLPIAKKIGTGQSYLPPVIQYFLVFGALLAGAIFLATITYHSIEIPGQKLGGRLIAKVRDRWTYEILQEPDSGL